MKSFLSRLSHECFGLFLFFFFGFFAFSPHVFELLYCISASLWYIIL